MEKAKQTEEKPRTNLTCAGCGAVIEKPDIEKKWRCPSCEEFFEEGDLVKHYECGSCGEIFTPDTSADGAGHRCPDCNKWGHTLVEQGCPDCTDSEIECDEVEVWECPECGENNIIGEEPEQGKPAPIKMKYKRGQYLIMVVPEFRERSTPAYHSATMSHGEIIGRLVKAPAHAQIGSVDRQKGIYHIYITEGTSWKGQPSWGSHSNTMTEAELDKVFKPITNEDHHAWMQKNNKELTQSPRCVRAAGGERSGRTKSQSPSKLLC